MEPQPELSITDSELFYRVGWFTRVRWVLGTLALLVLLVSWSLLGVRFRSGDDSPRMAPAAVAVLCVFLYNAAFTFAVRVVRARGQINRSTIVQLAMGQLACDMVAAVVLAHYTGGVDNFFIVLVLLPLVIATELLPRGLAYGAAAGAAALIHGLAWGEQQGVLPHVYVEWPGRTAQMFADPLYVLEVTGAMTVTIFAIVLVASSISHRLRVREADLEEAYMFLRRADEAKSFFMRKAGHEMRAPLSAVFSILGAIEHTVHSLPGEHRQILGRAQKRMRGLMELVDDLRTYSRLRSADGPLQPGPMSLTEVVQGTVELFRPRAEKAGLTLSCLAEPVRVEGNEEMLSEVVTNLVANAIQYTPAGGKVDVRLSAGRQEATLTVADSGIGISEAAREHLFEEFFRSGEARRMLPEGTGLGLAITRRIVELHGGRIGLSCPPEGGSLFTVRLPLRTSEARAHEGPGA